MLPAAPGPGTSVAPTAIESLSLRRNGVAFRSAVLTQQKARTLAAELAAFPSLAALTTHPIERLNALVPALEEGTPLRNLATELERHVRVARVLPATMSNCAVQEQQEDGQGRLWGTGWPHDPLDTHGAGMISEPWPELTMALHVCIATEPLGVDVLLRRGECLHLQLAVGDALALDSRTPVWRGAALVVLSPWWLAVEHGQLHQRLRSRAGYLNLPQ